MKHNLNTKVIATGLFNVADQIHALDTVRDSLRSLNHIVMDNGHFRVFIQSKKIKGELKVEILNSVLGKLSHPLVNEVVSYLKGSGAANELKEISTFFEYNSRFFLLGSSYAPFNNIPLRGNFGLILSDHVDNYKLHMQLHHFYVFPQM